MGIMTVFATIAEISRYPVKGLSPDRMDGVRLTAGETLPHDRAWAIENGPSGFDPAAPVHLSKSKFLMLMRNERLALLDIQFDDASATLTVLRGSRPVVTGQLTDRTGRQLIEQFFSSFASEDLRGPARIVSAENHSFSDVPEKCVSIINRASVEEIARIVGKPVDPLRFRGNFLIEGADAFAEFDLVGRRLRFGGATIEAFARIQRCAATNVDPGSAARDMQIPKTLMGAFGHMDCGVYAKVVDDGDVAVGDTLTQID